MAAAKTERPAAYCFAVAPMLRRWPVASRHVSARCAAIRQPPSAGQVRQAFDIYPSNAAERPHPGVAPRLPPCIHAGAAGHGAEERPSSAKRCARAVLSMTPFHIRLSESIQRMTSPQARSQGMRCRIFAVARRRALRAPSAFSASGAAGSFRPRSKCRRQIRRAYPVPPAATVPLSPGRRSVAASSIGGCEGSGPTDLDVVARALAAARRRQQTTGPRLSKRVNATAFGILPMSCAWEILNAKKSARKRPAAQRPALPGKNVNFPRREAPAARRSDEWEERAKATRKTYRKGRWRKRA